MKKIRSIWIREKRKTPLKTARTILLYSLNMAGMMAVASMLHFFYLIRSGDKLAIFAEILGDGSIHMKDRLDMLLVVMLVALPIVLAALVYIEAKTMSHGNELRREQINLMYVLGYRESTVVFYEWKYSLTDFVLSAILSFLWLRPVWYFVKSVESVEMLALQTGISVESGFYEGLVVSVMLFVFILNTFGNVREHYKYYLS